MRASFLFSLWTYTFLNKEDRIVNAITACSRFFRGSASFDNLGTGTNDLRSVVKSVERNSKYYRRDYFPISETLFWFSCYDDIWTRVVYLSLATLSYYSKLFAREERIHQVMNRLRSGTYCRIFSFTENADEFLRPDRLLESTSSTLHVVSWTIIKFSFNTRSYIAFGIYQIWRLHFPFLTIISFVLSWIRADCC